MILNEIKRRYYLREYVEIVNLCDICKKIILKIY